MELKIHFKQMESSKAVEEKIALKAEKLKKFFQGKIKVDWTCSCRSEGHRSDVTVTGDGINFHATSTDEGNFYKTVDDAIDKISVQLKKKNEMVKSKIHREGRLPDAPATADQDEEFEEE